MSDFNETRGEHMEEETADELQGRESDLSGFLRVAVIACVESHLAVLATDQATVGDGHSVGVAADIRIDLLGTSKRLFRVDHPLLASEFFEETIEGCFLF